MIFALNYKFMHKNRRIEKLQYLLINLFRSTKNLVSGLN